MGGILAVERRGALIRGRVVVGPRPALLRPGGQAARRRGGEVAKRPGGQAARRRGGEVAKRPGGQAARRRGGQAAGR
ncbi:hypothetical protein [Streptomyces sp. SID5643]|uniref:hypothetical protein n=1 Tax=Streptomyces sp. SID5643 TaxID=2690307 RepID=UPI0013FC6C18|nr:hypothetical protein [Streptomyces sp. SID5643]MZF87857.1 hypothetical protein [Streptomyces sp. SID5643]